MAPIPEKAADWHEVQTITSVSQQITRLGFYLMTGAVMIGDEIVDKQKQKGERKMPSDAGYSRLRRFSISVVFPDGTTPLSFDGKTPRLYELALALQPSGKGRGENLENVIAGILTSHVGRELEGALGLNHRRLNSIAIWGVNYLKLSGIPTPFEAVVKNGNVIDYAQLPVAHQGPHA